MKTLVALVLATTLCVAAGAEIMFQDSFEGPSPVNWQKSWGPAERSQDMAQDGAWAIRESLEDKYGLSVWYTEFPAHPRAIYKATAWVFIPPTDKKVSAALRFTRRDWSGLAGAETIEQGKWVKLEATYENKSERTVRLQMFQGGAHQAGVGGTLMYWDNVTLERELGEIKLDEGIMINPYVIEGLEVTPAGGMSVKVAPGKIDVDGKTVEVTQETVLTLEPARVIRVRDEQAKLTDEEPRGYSKGTPLQLCLGPGVTIAGCLDPGSLVIKQAAGPDAPRYEEGKDWRADKLWARVGRLDGAIGADTTVFMDYDMSLMRLDTIFVRSDGTLGVRQGAEHKMIPEPPKPDAFARPLCNVWLPYNCREITPELVYPIGPPYPSATQAQIAANAALLPRTIEKLNQGGDFTIVFWGDSVTCGGDASSQEKAFPLAFTNWLRIKYPQANIKYVNAGTGGWNSDGKLPLFEEQVMAHEPDLMVIEFVNDMGMSREKIFANYTKAVGRVREIGGEVIIVTPHFVRPDRMGAGNDMRTPETRAAVTYLREFAAENNVALADASKRWEHLWVEGLPYITLLYNSINHPEDRGHWLFVEELQKCFPVAAQ